MRPSIVSRRRCAQARITREAPRRLASLHQTEPMPPVAWTSWITRCNGRSPGASLCESVCVTRQWCRTSISFLVRATAWIMGPASSCTKRALLGRHCTEEGPAVRDPHRSNLGLKFNMELINSMPSRACLEVADATPLIQFNELNGQLNAFKSNDSSMPLNEGINAFESNDSPMPLNEGIDKYQTNICELRSRYRFFRAVHVQGRQNLLGSHRLRVLSCRRAARCRRLGNSPWFSQERTPIATRAVKNGEARARGVGDSSSRWGRRHFYRQVQTAFGLPRASACSLIQTVCLIRRDCHSWCFDLDSRARPASPRVQVLAWFFCIRRSFRRPESYGCVSGVGARTQARAKGSAASSFFGGWQQDERARTSSASQIEQALAAVSRGPRALVRQTCSISGRDAV